MHGYIVLRLIVSVCKQPAQRQDSEIRYLRNIRHRCLTEIDAPHESRAVCHSADCGNVVILILIAGISVQSAVVTKQIVSILHGGDRPLKDLRIAPFVDLPTILIGVIIGVILHECDCAGGFPIRPGSICNDRVKAGNGRTLAFIDFIQQCR